ncbi:hypothetical protein AB0C29_12280 [Actinoplanes sp. NPDC048791]|uniref:hypothetical protein n=1 Tax=Actinoplanes sp. NPDC048791 TaxID=3154623 RepID=UPI0033DA4F31
MDYRQVRDAIAAERAKLPTVDYNGRPITAPAEPAAQSAPASPPDVPPSMRNLAQISDIRRRHQRRQEPPRTPDAA